MPIVFRNVSSRSCRLQGYPGVAGLNAAGQQVAQAVRTPHPNGSGRGVTLKPGQVASSVVESSDMPTGTQTRCPQYTLLVTPPNETHSTHLRVTTPGCGVLRVLPVVTGTSGI